MNIEILKRLESRSKRYLALAEKYFVEAASDPGNRHAEAMCQKTLEDAQAAVFIFDLASRELKNQL